MKKGTIKRKDTRGYKEGQAKGHRKAREKSLDKYTNEVQLKTYNNLNPRQKRFVDEYLRTGNAYQSAVRAGFSKNTAINAHKNFLGENRSVKKALIEKYSSNKLMSREEALNVVEGVYSEVISGSKREDLRVTTAEKLAKLKGLLSDNLTLKADINSKSLAVTTILDSIDDIIKEAKE